MKRILIIIGFVMIYSPALFACDLCQKNQPEILKDVTHGTGPQSQWDFVITWVAVIIVAITLFFSIKFLVRPRENDPGHIKNIIVNPNHPSYE